MRAVACSVRLETEAWHFHYQLDFLLQSASTHTSWSQHYVGRWALSQTEPLDRFGGTPKHLSTLLLLQASPGTEIRL